MARVHQFDSRLNGVAYLAKCLGAAPDPGDSSTCAHSPGSLFSRWGYLSQGLTSSEDRAETQRRGCRARCAAWPLKCCQHVPVRAPARAGARMA